jgi:hypothetical protein
MNEHTPGPWQAEFGEAVYVLDRERGRVCTINWLRGPHGSLGRRTDEEGVSNARLIAAAPDLLEALLWLQLYAEVQVRNHPDATDTPNWKKVLAAIAKATGATK